MDPAAASTRFPGFRHHLRAVVNNGEGVYLFSERGVIALRGPHIASLAPLLNGQHDLATLFRSRPGGLDPEQVASLVGQLVEANLVALRQTAQAPADERAQAYWDACGVRHAPDGPAGRVGVVDLIGGDGLDARAVERALGRAGVATLVRTNGVVPDTSADLTVVVCDDYLRPELADIDRAYRAAGRPWLLTKPVGAQTWIGPVFQPGDTGCWHCLAHRLWGHRHAEACVQSVLGNSGPAPRPVSSVPPLTMAVSHLVALEVMKWLAGHRQASQRCVWTLDTYDLRGQLHELRSRPQCPECGDPSLVARQACRPVVLSPARKVSSSGGGHRTMTPGEVLDRYRHLVSPVTGMVKEVKRDPDAPPFVNAYLAGVNLARRVTGLGALRARLRNANGGKGVTPVDAEVGALCEAVERFSASWQGDEHTVRGSLRSLGGQAVHPNDCLLYDERQYADRVAWNRAHSPVNHVSRPFDPDAVLDWTPLWSLTERRHRLLPTAMVYLAAPPNPYMRADSNGNAAGCSIEDAILQGALELVERDAVALWWYNRTRVADVDLAAFGDPWLDEMGRRYAELGRELWVLDVTSDLPVPVFVAVSRDASGGPEAIGLGFGAHLDPHIALRRAVTELNQLLPAVLAGAPDGPDGFDDPDADAWLATATVDGQPYLQPDPALRPRVPADFGHVRRDDVRDDVEWLVATMAAGGLHTLVLDQTRPDVGMPVVKVVVPGLRPFWARFAAGRLYDVPVRQGRLAVPTGYHDLNPLPLFL